MIFVGIGLAGAVLTAVVRMLVRVVSAVGNVRKADGRRRYWGEQMGVFVLGALMAFSVLRPHEHVLQGLDSSALRLMALAIEGGRPLSSVDSVMQSAPPMVRPWLLLKPDEQGRRTRDRSYEVDLDSAETKPFFYPLLPLCAAGWDAVVPGKAVDYFVPVIALLFCLAVLVTGDGVAGILGSVAATALLIASPLPAWLFRGFYLETMSAVLLGLAALSFVLRGRDSDPTSVWEFFAVGLAVSFHPVMAVPAVPLVACMLFFSTATFWKLLVRAAAFAGGVLPVIVLTLFVVSPYGELSWNSIGHSLRHSSSIKPAVVFACAFGAPAVALLTIRSRIPGWLAPVGWKRWAWPVVLTFAAVVPTLVSLVYWEHGQTQIVERGMMEFFAGLQWPLGAVLGVAAAIVVWSGKSLREGILLSLVCASLPLFFYLKGAESMGLWSQRRLIVPFLLVLVTVLPALMFLIRTWCVDGPLCVARRVCVLVVCAVVGLHNLVRWPAPYVVRYEKGADAWVSDVDSIVGKRLVLFDYHPFSVPFSALAKTRALGLSEFTTTGGLSVVMPWLAAVAGNEDVLLAATYKCPEMEDGVFFEPTGVSVTGKFTRARSKTVLPAVTEQKVVSLEFYRVRRLGGSSVRMTKKVMDRGMLGLRGTWGTAAVPIRLPGIGNMPARWSRNGSGVVGPVPSAGESVRIVVEAAAAREDGISEQVLTIRPPWAGELLRLTVSNEYTRAEGICAGPAVSSNLLSGVYVFGCDYPYAPGSAGIRGYPSDLGALIHSVSVEVLPSSNTGR